MEKRTPVPPRRRMEGKLNFDVVEIDLLRCEVDSGGLWSDVEPVFFVSWVYAIYSDSTLVYLVIGPSLFGLLLNLLLQVIRTFEDHPVYIPNWMLCRNGNESCLQVSVWVELPAYETVNWRIALVRTRLMYWFSHEELRSEQRALKRIWKLSPKRLCDTLRLHRNKGLRSLFGPKKEHVMS